jgi:ribosomal-protein-alanine N-acetyltransferase
MIVLSEARMSQLRLSARPLEVADLPQIQSIESSVYEDPWSANLLSQSLTAPMTHTLGFFQGDLCVAYSIYQVIFTEAHLLNIAVRKDSQRRGYGGELLDLVMLDSSRKGAISMFLEVRPSNRTAIELYKHRGFKTLMTREKYYSNGEAAFVMVKELSEVE